MSIAMQRVPAHGLISELAWLTHRVGEAGMVIRHAGIYTLTGEVTAHVVPGEWDTRPVTMCDLAGVVSEDHIVSESLRAARIDGRSRAVMRTHTGVTMVLTAGPSAWTAPSPVHAIPRQAPAA